MTDNVETPENTEGLDNVENKYSLSDLVTFAGLQQPIEFKDAFADLMRDRLQVRVDDMRAKFAVNFFGNKDQEETSSEETGNETEESDEEENSEQQAAA